MEYHQLGALALFAFVSTFTPGPNNIMLMTSGANVGFKRTIPHMLGITFGFGAMLILVGIGLMGLFHAYPLTHLDFKSIELELFAVLDVQNRHQRQNRSKTRFSPDVFFRGCRIPVGEPKRLVDGVDGHYGIHQRRFLA